MLEVALESGKKDEKTDDVEEEPFELDYFGDVDYDNDMDYGNNMAAGLGGGLGLGAEDSGVVNINEDGVESFLPIDRKKQVPPEIELVETIREFRHLVGVANRFQFLRRMGVAEKDGRVRSSFTLTSTGRLAVKSGPQLLCMDNPFQILDVARPSFAEEKIQTLLGPVPVMVSLAGNLPPHRKYRPGHAISVKEDL